MQLEYVKRIGISAAYKSAEILRSRFGKILKIRKQTIYR